MTQSLIERMRAKAAAKGAVLNASTKPTPEVQPKSKDGKSVLLAESKPDNSLENLMIQVQEQDSVLTDKQKELEESLNGKREQMSALEGLDSSTLINELIMLEGALVEKTPEIRTLSSSIRKNLVQYPELTHILDDDQLGIVVSGYLHVAGVETAPKTKQAKSKATTKKIEDLASKSLDELF